MRRDLARLDLHLDLQRAAGIEPGAASAREPVAQERRRLAERAVAPDELAAVAGVRASGLGGVPEGDPVRELRVVGVAREDRAGRRRRCSVTTNRRSPARGGPRHHST